MSDPIKFYYDNTTKACLGAFDAELAPPNATGVTAVPLSGKQTWDETTQSWFWPAGRYDLPPLTARQIRLALIGAGIYEATETAIAGMGAAEKVTWEYATEYERNHPLVIGLGQTLDLTADAIDAMWLQAMQL